MTSINATILGLWARTVWGINSESVDTSYFSMPSWALMLKQVLAWMLYAVDGMWPAFLYRLNLHHSVPFSLQLVCKSLAVTASLVPMVPLLLQSQPMMWNSRCCNSASVVRYLSEILSWPWIYLGTFFHSSENVTQLRDSNFVNVVNHLVIIFYNPPNSSCTFPAQTQSLSLSMLFWAAFTSEQG